MATRDCQQSGSWSSLVAGQDLAAAAALLLQHIRPTHQILSVIALEDTHLKIPFEDTHLKIPFEDGQAELPGCSSPGGASASKCLPPREHHLKGESNLQQHRGEAWHQSGLQRTPCIYFQVCHTFKLSVTLILWYSLLSPDNLTAPK